jgi:hypothetical protein
MQNNLVSESVGFYNWKAYIKDTLKEMGKHLDSQDFRKRMEDPNQNPLVAAINVPSLKSNNHGQ